MTNTNEFENVNSTNDTEETVNEEEIEINLDEEVEDIEGLKQTIKTLQAQKDHWRKKAQQEKPTEKKVETKEEVKSTNGLSISDTLALIKNGVDEDDIDEIVEFSQFKKISIAEALKTNTVKKILSEKQEMRRTAEATSTGTVKRSSTKVSDEDIVSNANSGKLPEDPITLAQAKFNLKLKK